MRIVKKQRRDPAEEETEAEAVEVVEDKQERFYHDMKRFKTYFIQRTPNYAYNLN